jgi:hypothetical protein
MRIDDENMELMLFDLLEGNLDAETERIVREEIADNPVWEREWKLIQKTVLIPENDVVFEKKYLLLKPISTANTGTMYWRWIAVSVAACLIFFIWLGTQDQSKNILPDLATVKPIRPNQKTVESNQAVQPNPSKSESQKTESVPVVQKAKEHVTPIYEPETITKNPVQESPVFRKVPEPIIGLTVSEPHFQQMAINKPILTLIPMPSDSGNIQNHLAIIPGKPEPDKSLRNLLIADIAKWIEPYRNPKLKLAAGRGDNKLVLMFTLNTSSYHAAAVVQLKTKE